MRWQHDGAAVLVLLQALSLIDAWRNGTRRYFGTQLIAVSLRTPNTAKPHIHEIEKKQRGFLRSSSSQAACDTCLDRAYNGFYMVSCRIRTFRV